MNYLLALPNDYFLMIRTTRHHPAPSRLLSAAFAVTVFASTTIRSTSAFVVVIPDATRTALLAPSARKPSAKNKRATATALYSSIGGGNEPPPPPDDDGGASNEWDDFLNPNHEESENLFKAREFMSENSLPISHGMEDVDADEFFITDDRDGDVDKESGDSSAIVGPNDLAVGGLTREALASNPYIKVVSKLSPSELISKFTSTAHPRVQNAVRSTILGLIGGLPKMAFDTTTITTGQKLASLMFQLQMTGYMFKNAEYRLSVQQSLGVDSDRFSGDRLLLGGDADSDNEQRDLLAGKVKGKLRIKYGGSSSSSSSEEEDDDSTDREEGQEPSAGGGGGMEMEVDAAAYMAELRAEVEQLRNELTSTEKDQEEALRKDLLMYIRTLPQQELQSLTNTMSQDVLVAMKGLVNAVLSGIGEGQIGPSTVTEQSGEAMAQLCMWQLVIGYNLRTLEVREEMRSSLSAGNDTSDDDSGVDLSPGALE